MPRRQYFTCFIPVMANAATTEFCPPDKNTEYWMYQDPVRGLFDGQVWHRGPAVIEQAHRVLSLWLQWNPICRPWMQPASLAMEALKWVAMLAKIQHSSVKKVVLTSQLRVKTQVSLTWRRAFEISPTTRGMTVTNTTRPSRVQSPRPSRLQSIYFLTFSRSASISLSLFLSDDSLSPPFSLYVGVGSGRGKDKSRKRHAGTKSRTGLLRPAGWKARNGINACLVLGRAKLDYAAKLTVWPMVTSTTTMSAEADPV